MPAGCGATSAAKDSVPGSSTQRTPDPDLDSIDCDPAAEVPPVQSQDSIGVLDSRGFAALEPVHIPEPVEMDRRSVPETSDLAAGAAGSAILGQHWPRVESGQYRNLHPVDRDVLFGEDFNQIVTVADGLRGHIVADLFRLEESGSVAGDTVETNFRELIGVRNLQFDLCVPGWQRGRSDVQSKHPVLAGIG